MYKKSAIALLSILSVCTFQSCVDHTRTIGVDMAFVEALSEIEPNMKSVEWNEKSGYIVAMGNIGKYETTVWFKPDVRWGMTETEYKHDVSQLPQAVENTIQASPEYGTWNVDDIDFFERPDLSLYVVELESPQLTQMFVYITPAGDILKTTTKFEAVTPATVFI